MSDILETTPARLPASVCSPFSDWVEALQRAAELMPGEAPEQAEESVGQVLRELVEEMAGMLEAEGERRRRDAEGKPKCEHWLMRGSGSTMCDLANSLRTWANAADLARPPVL